MTLFDRDTPVWYDAAMPLDVRQWIGFHTASPVVAKHAAAHFAILAGPRDGALLSAFEAGTLEFPERSATLLIAVERFDGGLPVELRGPGIADAVRIAPPGSERRSGRRGGAIRNASRAGSTRCCSKRIA